MRNLPAVLRGWRGWLVLAAVVALSLVVVAVTPNAVRWTRPLPRAEAERELASDHYAEAVRFGSDGQAAQVYAEVFREEHTDPGSYRIRIAVGQPDPRLHRIDLRFRTMAAPGLPSAALRLDAPGGDWPPMTFGVTSEGDQRFAAEGLDSNTTVVDFFLPVERVQELPDELGVDITFELRSTPGLTSWAGRAHVALPLAGLDDLCVDLNQANRDTLRALAGLELDAQRAQELVDGRPYQSLDDLQRIDLDPAKIDLLKDQGIAATAC